VAAAGDQFGLSVAGAGDVNGDGFADVIVGARFKNGTLYGAAYIYYGGPGADASPDLTLTGAVHSDGFGNSVAGAGDINGDGFADVIVGAPGNDAGGMDAGQASFPQSWRSPDAHLVGRSHSLLKFIDWR